MIATSQNLKLIEEILPLNGIGGQKEIVVCNERGDWWRYKSDNTAIIIQMKYGMKIYRFSFVGDSFTWICINGEKIYVELLRDNCIKLLILTRRYWPTYISRCF